MSQTYLMATLSTQTSTTPARTTPDTNLQEQTTQAERPRSSSIWKRWYFRIESVLAYFREWLSMCWSRLDHMVSTARQRWSPLTFLGVASTLILGAWGLRYAYDQRTIAIRAFKLAEWTARKDFREDCLAQEVRISNDVGKHISWFSQASRVTLSHQCQHALRHPLVESPYVSFGRQKRGNWTYERDQGDQQNEEDLLHGFIQPAAVTYTQLHRPWIEIFACGLLVFWNRRKLRRVLRKFLEDNVHEHRPGRSQACPVETLPSMAPIEPMGPMSTNVEASLDNGGGLRRRDVRQCNICDGRTYSHKKGLHRHQGKHHLDEREYQCGVADYAYAGSYRLDKMTAHMKNRHLGGKKHAG